MNRINTITTKGIGKSMFPLIEDGDRITYTTEKRNISRGDIIVFLWNKKLVAHRVITQDAKKGIITKGDNCLEYDGVVKKSHIIGTVISLQKKKKTVYLDRGIGKIANNTSLLLGTLPLYISLFALKVSRKILRVLLHIILSF